MNNKKYYYKDYVKRLQEIRTLSSPSLEGITDEDEYSERLRNNFIRIGQLAAENRNMLETVFYPLVQSDRELSEDETDEILSFGSELVSAMNVENLDLPILSLLSDRLLQDAQNRQDLSAVVRRLDTRIDTCYALMIMMGRVSAYPEIADRFRQEGLKIGNFYISLLDPEKFAALDDECRDIVLTNARYTSVFYEKTICSDPEHNPELDLLEKMLGLLDDDFYQQLTPDFGWRYFHYRTLNYYAKTTDLCNFRRFGPKELSRICERTEEFMKLWQSNPAHFDMLDNEKQVKMLVSRNRYLAGHIDFRTYRDELISLYHMRDSERYDLNGIYDNLLLPAEFICLIKDRQLTEEDKQTLEQFYRDMILYAFRMPNSGTLTSMLEYYIEIVDRFIEIPGGITFEELVLQCMAALHPPTYIHSVMVAELSSCLCRHLIDRQPELLVGVLGCATPEEIATRREELINFTYHAGLCHDFGKLAIIDTILVYGRQLLSMEFELIKTHPRTGYEMMLRYESTRAYADAALGHHRWYDNSDGYPEEFDISKSPIKTIISLIQCADCLDAATDSVGRSYSTGKTYEAFVGEVRADIGTRYAPWLLDMLTDAAITKDLLTMLRQEREQNYRNTYHLLHEMQGQTEESATA